MQLRILSLRFPLVPAAQFQAAQASGTKPSFEQMRAVHEQIRAETLQQLTPVFQSRVQSEPRSELLRNIA